VNYEVDAANADCTFYIRTQLEVVGPFQELQSEQAHVDNVRGKARVLSILLTSIDQRLELGDQPICYLQLPTLLEEGFQTGYRKTITS